VNFLYFGADDAAQSVELFSDRTGHYVHISSASVYHRPLPKGPVSESTFAHNPDHAYMRDKVEAERVFLAAFAERSLPLTIVRPAHTYDEAIAPLPGGWAVIDRIERGEPVVVQGDGTSLWTYTHAADLAVGLIGLLGRPSAFGEAFHITSDDVLS
jgi:nucleoside-diphosphate-sugar epimerase